MAEMEVVGRAGGGVAMVIPAALFQDETDKFSSSSSSPPPSFPFSGSCWKMPERLRKRMVEWESRNALISAEVIEAKLRDADHRRQEFYDQLSKKASPKRKSPSKSSRSNEELEQRIEARLQAAEEKRRSMLAKAQKRLARLDELRQAARTEVEIRQEKERKELSQRVELRFQQAEANRSRMLRRDRMRRALQRERTSQSVSRRMARESKYKEHVYSLIHQKRAAAEKKRMVLLEAEKRRASEKFHLARQVARSVSHQREAEKRRLRDEMEHRLLSAKKKRAEYLKQRRSANSQKQIMNDHGNVLSRKLARCWGQFLQRTKTTVVLAKNFAELKINERHVKTMPFEQLAHMIESRATLRVLKPFLDRLENRFKFSIAFGCKHANSPSYVNIDHLLKKVAIPRSKVGRNSSVRQKRKTEKEPAKAPEKLSRYQVRLVLCAYMIITHPSAVFSGQGELEIVLASSAAKFINEFEVLVRTVLQGPMPPQNTSHRNMTFRTQLAAFDSAWCAFLNDFVAWKLKDAESLKQDLVRAACQLELSMMQKCKMTKGGDSCELTYDLKAIKKQVADDQKLLRQKIRHLSGDAGLKYLESALSDTRSLYFKENEKGNPSTSPTSPFQLPVTPPTTLASSFSSVKERNENSERSKHVVRSLFKELPSSSGKASSSTDPKETVKELYGMSSVTENEIIVNEYLHKQAFPAADQLEGRDGGVKHMEDQVRETMKAAFWDSITESMKQDYGRLIGLMTEVRDELCGVAPDSWKEEINEVIDLVFLTKIINSGNLDMELLRKILAYVLTTLQKLSAPADDDKLREKNETLLRELTLACLKSGESKEVQITALVKGVRFVLEEIQALKEEISKAHIKISESFLNGPAGVEYLKSAFSHRYGPPAEATTCLPLTYEWLSSIRAARDLEWNEHTSLSQSHSHWSVPATVLKAGREVLQDRSISGAVHSSTESGPAGTEQPQCSGDVIDSLVRLGILKLTSRVVGATLESLPETLRLNLMRLRRIQGQLQKIVVIVTSALVFRQVLLSDAVPTSSPSIMENVLPRFIEQLSKVLDTNEGAGMEEIILVMDGYLEEADNNNDTVKIQAKKELVARMLMKSLQAGDAVFERVSAAVYRASRGIVLGGSGPKGRELAMAELQKVGAALLINELVGAAKPIAAMATVSVSVHGKWYASLVENACR